VGEKVRRVLVNRDGFTLLETLVVLFLVSILVGFPILSVQKAQESVRIKLFIEELSSGITLIQNHAIMNGEATTFQVKSSSDNIHFRIYGKPSHPLNFTISPPEEVQLIGGTKRYIFKSHSGNIGKYETFSINTSEGVYDFVFQMGSGRFYVRKKE